MTTTDTENILTLHKIPFRQQEHRSQISLGRNKKKMFSWDVPKKWMVSERAFQAEEMWMMTPICLKGGSRSTGRSETPHLSLQRSAHYSVLNRGPVNICGWISSFIQTPEAFKMLVKKTDEDVTEETCLQSAALPGCRTHTPGVGMWLEICRAALQTQPPERGRNRAHAWEDIGSTVLWSAKELSASWLGSCREAGSVSDIQKKKGSKSLMW